MSLVRLIFWSVMLGGWSAFAGWLVAEIFLGRWANTSYLGSIVLSAVVSTFIGGGLSLVGSLSNPRLVEMAKRFGPGLLCGFVGGFIGSGLGSGLYALLAQQGGTIAVIARVLGWTAMGTCLGVVEGIYERSTKKTIKGAIGGALGGLVGGICFNPISAFVGSTMSSRAFAFVVLGTMIGLLVGLVQVVFKEAWLTVEKGFRPGRQLLLGEHPVTFGTSEKANMIFIAYGAKGVEPIHVKIERANKDAYVVNDQNSRTGTFVNGAPARTPIVLKNGDVIQFGVNEVRFFESVRQDAKRVAALAAPTAVEVQKSPPPTAPQVIASAAAALAAKPPAPLPPAASSRPAPTGNKPSKDACPACGCLEEGVIGKRRCRNCFNMF